MEGSTPKSSFLTLLRLDEKESSMAWGPAALRQKGSVMRESQDFGLGL